MNHDQAMRRSLERASTELLEARYGELYPGRDPADLPFSGMAYRSELIVRILRAESAAANWDLLPRDDT